MKRVKSIVYRYLTAAEFFNIYKPRGTEPSGGGQTYIDFPIHAIPADAWPGFFGGVNGLVTGQRTHGPQWRFPVGSVGVAPQNQAGGQQARIYQRRAQSFTISGQHIEADRVAAWRPDHGFPQPANPEDRDQLPEGLCVYMVRTSEGEVWAGWFINDDAHPSPCQDEAAEALLHEMLDPARKAGDAGIIAVEEGTLLLDEANAQSPFAASPAATAVITAIADATQGDEAADEGLIGRLFGEDVTREWRTQPDVRQRVRKTYRRNQRAAKDLKELYGYECQVSHEQGFMKASGSRYIEVHHLVPLGKDGDDDPLNMIVVDPRIHRMLHYADVDGVELQNIEQAADGTASLQIAINGQPYTIRWHPAHAERILQHQGNQ